VKERANWKKRAEDERALGAAYCDLAINLRRNLKRLADAAETLVGSHPDSPGFPNDEAEFEAALEEARRIYATSEGFDK
jgi:hypothetical protein